MNSLRRQRGFTLIEAMVYTGVSAVLLIIVYNVFEGATSHATRQRLAAEAQTEALVISEHIRRALLSPPPASVSAQSPAGQATYEPNRLTTLSRVGLDPENPEWNWVTIENAGSEEDRQSIRLKVGDKSKPLGNNGDLFNASIRFEYAVKVNDDLIPQIVEDWDSGTPAFVRYTIVVDDARGRMSKPAILVTGVATR